MSKIYERYVGFHCNSKGIIPEKLHTYRNIFNNEFNLGFHIPKKDRCDLCEEYNVSQKVQNVSDQLNKKDDAHIQSKVRTKMERDNDRTSEKAVLCFDLENVSTCPRANISIFFYKRKLNVYNLTAHMSLNKRIYTAIWVEHQTGRCASEIASALLKVLERVLQDVPDLEVITLWSDS